MSEENLVVVRAIVDAVASQDLPRLLELTDPDVTLHSFFAALREGGTYNGHDGIREWASDIADTFDLIKVEIEDTLTVGDIVVVVGRIHYRGKGSGVDSDAPAGYLFEFRDGRCVRLRAVRDPEDALRKLGLPE